MIIVNGIKYIKMTKIEFISLFEKLFESNVLYLSINKRFNLKLIEKAIGYTMMYAFF